MIRLFLSLLILFFNPLTLFGQEENILINEFGYGNGISFIELKNLNEEAFDAEGLFVIYNGETFPMNANNVICGFPPNNRIIDGKDQQAFYFTDVSNEGGELILSRSDSVSTSDDIIDYVVWGESDGLNESLAVEAMQWEAGVRAPAFFGSGSLEYYDNETLTMQWAIQAVSSSCVENGSRCDIIQGQIHSYEDEFCICDGISEDFSISFNGNIYQNIGTIITDENKVLLDSTFNLENLSYYEDLCFEDSIFISFLGFDGEISGLEIGKSVDSLIGCYAITDRIYLKGTKIETFSTLLTVNDLLLNEADTIQLCKANTEAALFSFSSESNDSIAYYFFDEFGIIILEYSTNNFELDFSELEAGTYRLVPYAFTGEVFSSLELSQPNVSGCNSMSSTSYEIVIEDNGEGNCISNVENIKFTASLEIQYSSTTSELIISSSNPELYVGSVLQIFDVNGKIVVSKRINSIADARVNFVSIPKGLYIASMVNKNNRWSQTLVAY